MVRASRPQSWERPAPARGQDARAPAGETPAPRFSKQDGAKHGVAFSISVPQNLSAKSACHPSRILVVYRFSREFHTPMCGIAGFFGQSRSIHEAPVGQVLLTMLQGLACRGPDSTGVALFGPGADHQVVLRIKLGEEGDCSARLAALRDVLDRDFNLRY